MIVTPLQGEGATHARDRVDDQTQPHVTAQRRRDQREPRLDRAVPVEANQRSLHNAITLSVSIAPSTCEPRKHTRSTRDRQYAPVSGGTLE